MCGFENSSECRLRCRKDKKDFSRGQMNSSILINALFIFMLAGSIGFEVIRRVSPLLHTPLMSLTNALDAIAVVGAILIVGEHKSKLSTVLGLVVSITATSQLIGGFVSTDGVRRMFT